MPQIYSDALRSCGVSEGHPRGPGRPSAATVLLTGGILVAAYAAWLKHERAALLRGTDNPQFQRSISRGNPTASWHYLIDERCAGSKARQQAPVPLWAAGVPLTSAEADRMWGGPLV
ncbi:hypothetical protein M446_4737 [Methylobacterium sp. 4-46]|nr:hypothetical protein M446_4737 [Methylobacterium sp. 4-46]